MGVGGGRYQCAQAVGSRSGLWGRFASRGEEKVQRGGQQRRTVPEPGPTRSPLRAQHAEEGRRRRRRRTFF